ncbi:MAG: aminomethyl-transferring glycine dehydrogenase subunit GcvPB [Clostridiales bacterium]
MKKDRLIFEISKKGHKGYSLPKCDVPLKSIDKLLGKDNLRKNPAKLPEVSENNVVRHYVNLSNKNYGVDSGFYPLGSCTMKYNPKINEYIARLDEFTNVHPYQSGSTVQGCLEIMSKTEKYLKDLSGMDEISLQPAAGAHGELTGLMIMKQYHILNKQLNRNKVIIPDSAHGTNPASASMVGFEVIELKTNKRGALDIEELKALLDDSIAGLMLTNPSTLGIFEENIVEISDIIHNAGGLLYYDGANMNAIMGITNPGMMGFDIVHFNLHKTFSTPHGGGGPGSGPIGVKKHLEKFLPVPIIKNDNNQYYLDYKRDKSIGKVKSFYGNFSLILRAYCYIRTMGREGLKEVSKSAVLNANYIMNRLKDYYHIPYNRSCMHEFVLSAKNQKKYGVSAFDIAKRLLDYGYHPPTMYFPLIVEEALMIEPTETESKDTIDHFIEVMIKIANECKENPEIVKSAPNNTYYKRLDEVGAARKPILNCCEYISS